MQPTMNHSEQHPNTKYAHPERWGGYRERKGDRVSLTIAVGLATLLLLPGCGTNPVPQPAPASPPASTEELQVTFHIPEMADRLELM